MKSPPESRKARPSDPARAAVLERIRQAVRASAAADLPVSLPDFPTFPEAVERFRSELEAVQGQFHDARGRNRLPAVLSEILAECATEEIYWEAPEIFEKHSIAVGEASQAFGPDRLTFSRHQGGRVDFPVHLDSRPWSRSRLETVRLSASSALCAIAETGTVVEAAGAGKGRLLSVLPPCHLVFLSQGDLMMNHREFFERRRLGSQGSALTFVTGPSRTADIEKQLVLGVHGPKKWFVVLTA